MARTCGNHTEQFRRISEHDIMYFFECDFYKDAIYCAFKRLKISQRFSYSPYVYVPGARSALEGDLSSIAACVIRGGKAAKIELYADGMTADERTIVKAGSLINCNRDRKAK